MRIEVTEHSALVTSPYATIPKPNSMKRLILFFCVLMAASACKPSNSSSNNTSPGKSSELEDYLMGSEWICRPIRDLSTIFLTFYSQSFELGGEGNDFDIIGKYQVNHDGTIIFFALEDGLEIIDDELSISGILKKEDKRIILKFKDLSSEKEEEFIFKKIDAPSSQEQTKIGSSTPAKEVKNDFASTAGIEETEVEPVKEEKPREPQKHVSQVPVQRFQQCVACFGGGQCSYCYGRGLVNYGSGDMFCAACGGSGRCPICAGRGGEYVVEYETRVDYY